MKELNPNKSLTFCTILKNNAFAYSLALALAYAFKWHYSMASPEQLAWALTPAAKLTEALFQIPFDFETGTGYICRERKIIIAPACAGVNFMIMCFSISIFPFIHRFRELKVRFAWLSASIAIALIYATSVNAMRIFFSLYLYETGISGAWIDPGKLHRINGIIVYLAALYLLFTILEKAADSLEGRRLPERPGDRSSLPQNGRKMLLWMAPLVAYVFLTIMVPLINRGTSRSDALFLEHCVTVASACLVVLSAVFLLKYFLSWRIKKR